MNPVDFLRASRRRLIEKLSPEDVAEFDRLERAIEQWAPKEELGAVAGEFAALKIIDAVRVYLHRMGKPVPLPTLVQALVHGGAGSAKGDRPAAWKISQSIGYHLEKGSLKGTREAISLPEWAEPPDTN